MPTFTVNGKPVDSLPGIGERVTLDPKIQAGLIDYIEANKNDPGWQRFIAGDGIAKRDPAPDDPSLSPAARRYARIAAKRNAPPRENIKRVEIDGEEWHIRAWDAGTINKYEMSVSRNAAGKIMVGDEDKMYSWLAALLHCGVVQGPDDYRPMFTLVEAREWAESMEPDIRNTAVRLEKEICLFNIDYFDPQARQEAKDAYEAAGIDGESLEKKESLPPSSTLPTPTADGGFELTDSTPAPPSSPPDSTPTTEPDAITTTMPL